jgi:multidrug efflux pump subunit AcrA (membrane-fusion protein)
MVEWLKKIWNFKSKEENVSLRKQTVKALGIFFVLLIMFTLLSRVANTFTMTQVVVETPTRRSIDQFVRQEGTIEANQVRGIFALNGLRIGEVNVTAGSNVDIGTPLLTVEISHLDEIIEDLKIQLQIADLNISDIEHSQYQANQEKATELARAYEDLNHVVTVGNASVIDAFMFMENARVALGNATDETSEALKEVFWASQRTYQDALTARDEQIRASNRRIEDARIEPTQNSAIEIAILERERIELSLQDYLLFREQNGMVISPMNGIVVSLDASVVVGGLTPITAIMQIADVETGFIFMATIGRDEQRHISQGDRVTLELARGDSITDLTIDTMTRNSLDDELMDVKVIVPADDRIRLHDLATMRAEGESTIFSTTVPVSALHRGGAGVPDFVLVVREENTILGTQIVVDEVAVTVHDRNERFVAVGDFELNNDQRVVVFSEREIRDGDRVLLAD